MKTAAVILVLALTVGAAQLNSPLLDQSFRIPFDRITAGSIVPGITQLLAEARQKRDAYIANTSTPTFENTMTALEDIGEDLGRAMGIAQHLESVASTPELRAAVNEVLPKYSEFASGLALDQGIYARVKKYAATAEAKSLTGPRKRFLKLTLDDFRRAGAGLGPRERARLNEINIEQSKLRKQFSDNVLDATNAFELIIKDEAKLAGLPESARAAARDSAKQKGVDGWRFTLQAPSYQAVLTYMDDAAVREKMYRAYNSRAAGGAASNLPVMKRLLELRRERARLLGYRNYADFMTEDRMAKNSNRVRQFLASLEKRTRPFYEKENDELLQFRRSLEGPAAPALQLWDISYYAEKLRKSRYDFDEEVLRPYFPAEAVFKGMFDVAQRLYGIKVVGVEGVPVWNRDVQFYEIRDADGSLLGGFYTDFYPREDKRGGAWSGSLITGGPLYGGPYKPHLGSISGNVNPPAGGKPALLNKRDVETVFHEFGHQIHHLLGKSPIRGLTDVAWDFVELPSQIMENWTWERESLNMLARHYETGATIPEDLFQKMTRARVFRAANAQMRQLSLGAVDIALHVDYDEKRDGDMLVYARKIQQRFTPALMTDDYALIAAFTHIFSGGYACGYYSYKWAEVLDADAFTRFQKEGIFNPTVGMAFRREILEKGNLEDADVLFRNFMGRDPDPEALMRRYGLVTK
jgi:oligopeptidase A